ncbi:UNVERIFIED_CONTAM: hypothetical protein Slati_2146600 [Sesamum latifolium]|uniref:Uncharacterized protein n=1 Tax=Sesamum latifolium TaxID=2727402 RepID=A0AAW2WTF5_9LAMI
MGGLMTYHHTGLTMGPLTISWIQEATAKMKSLGGHLCSLIMLQIVTLKVSQMLIPSCIVNHRLCSKLHLQILCNHPVDLQALQPRTIPIERMTMIHPAPSNGSSTYAAMGCCFFHDSRLKSTTH